MPDVKRTVKLVTEQRATEDIAAENMPWRDWSVEIFLVNEQGQDVPANVFEKATYKLHESFGAKATQTIKKPPFRVAEKGWGEFDMLIVLTGAHKGGDHTITHDLNFQSERYEATHTITFRNPKPELLNLLKDSGPAGDENGTKKPAPGKKGKKDKFVDMEKLADGLQQLQEDDMLQVVQMVYDNKSNDTWTKNDVENGEFSVDLYTLPDNLVKMLWDFTAQKVSL